MVDATWMLLNAIKCNTNAYECMNLGWGRVFLINVVHRGRFLSILGALKVPSPFFHSHCILNHFTTFTRIYAWGVHLYIYMSELVEAMKRKSEAIDAARAEADAIRMHCLAFVCVHCIFSSSGYIHSGSLRDPPLHCICMHLWMAAFTAFSVGLECDWMHYEFIIMFKGWMRLNVSVSWMLLNATECSLMFKVMRMQ